MALTRKFRVYMYTLVIPRTPSLACTIIIVYYSGSNWSDHPGLGGKWQLVILLTTIGHGSGAGAGVYLGGGSRKGHSEVRGGHREQSFQEPGERSASAPQ
eukprot:5171753-Pleurochrysis_carterae.AAC.1